MKLPNRLAIAGMILWTSSLLAADVLSVAVFDFESKDDLQDIGPKIAALLSAHLSAEPMVMTVERAELAKILGEQELGLSGTVSADTAAKVGQLTGAKVLITGRVFKVDKEILAVTKVISTETSRVYGEVVKGASASAISDMSQELAKKIGKIIEQKGDTLVAKVVTHEERVEKIKKALKGGRLPAVYVKITEHHVNRPIIDPAAETEFGLLMKDAGFTLIDSASTEKPEVEFLGEAFSEFGMRKGNLITCRARVEIKVVEKATGRILAIDRQTSVGVDLSEQVAAKSALQNAAAILAERVIPKAVR